MTTDTVTGSDYGNLVRTHLTRVEQHNAAALDDVAELVLAAVEADGTILTAGAGHSLAAVAETFYRAGGLACVRPIYHPELLPMHGAISSTSAERRSGLAGEVLREAGLAPHDVLFVFSTSGVNYYPVELAQEARERGLPGRGRHVRRRERPGPAPCGRRRWPRSRPSCWTTSCPPATRPTRRTRR